MRWCALRDMNMKDFTLYLNSIDSTRFSKKQSRFGLDHFADEWKAAWQSYERHVLNAASWLPIGIAEYALAGWRQDLSNALCIRKKPITAMEFAGVERAALFKVKNPVLDRELVFRFNKVAEFSWMDNSASDSSVIGPIEERQEDVAPTLIIYVEELRFPEKGLIEHEIVFLDGSRLLIKATSLTLNLSDYRVCS